MSLVERIKAILQNPKSAWTAIEEEKRGTLDLVTGYAAILAAIPPIAAFVGVAITGYVGYRVPFARALLWALIVYVLSLASIFVMAEVVDRLAGVFGGQRDFSKALKVAVYAPTAAWVASIFDVNPPMAFLSLMGLYSFYLLYTGLAALMKPPAGRLLVYTVAVVACMAVAWLIVLGVAAKVLGVPVFAVPRF
jgi:Yip1 domain